MTKTSINLFESKKIRIHWDIDKAKWFFSLTDSFSGNLGEKAANMFLDDQDN
jgi:hypothetical protein